MGASTEQEERGGLPRMVLVKTDNGMGEQGPFYRSVLATHHHKLIRVPESILDAHRVEDQYHIRINLYLAVILPPLSILRASLARASAHEEPFLLDEIALVQLAMQQLGEEDSDGKEVQEADVSSLPEHLPLTSFAPCSILDTSEHGSGPGR